MGDKVDIDFYESVRKIVSLFGLVKKVSPPQHTLVGLAIIEWMNFNAI